MSYQKKNPFFRLDFHIEKSAYPFADKKLLLFRENDVREKKACFVCLHLGGQGL